MTRKTKSELRAELYTIREERRHLSHREIMRKHDIPESTYWYYIKLINKEDKEIYEKHLADDMISELMNLDDMLMTAISNMKVIIENEKLHTRDRLQAQKDQIEYGINRLKIKNEVLNHGRYNRTNEQTANRVESGFIKLFSKDRV